MRSSKNRSRSKGNRNRSVGNIVNRVFDSSGPEGKVRGTPQQIIDKYNQLARDAQLSNDRVAAENFQQHAEHYLRMLAEAQREQDARREQQQQSQQQGQGGGQKDRGETGGQQRDAQQADAGGNEAAEAKGGGDGGKSGSFDTVMDGGADGDGGLVETPEAAPKPKRSRSRRAKKPEGGEAAQDGGGEGGKSDGDGKKPDDPPKEAAE
jgi:hypothetical protein